MSTRAVVVAAALLAVCALAAPLSGGDTAADGETAAVSHTIEYSSDSGKTWQRKATVVIQDDVAKVATEGAEAPVAKWAAADLANFQVAGQLYMLRARVGAEVVAMTKLSPCSLVTPKQYATPLGVTSERYGLLINRNRISGFKNLVLFSDSVCEPRIFKVAGDVRMRLSVSRLQAVAAPAAPQAVGVNPTSAEGPKKTEEELKKPKFDKDGKEVPPEDNRSFFQKYWIYIVAFMGWNLVQTFLNPATKDGAAAAAAKK
jgi:hypothetical protein